jgi:hypothetical protein
MPKYLKIAEHDIEKVRKDYAYEGDPPGCGQNSIPFSIAMLAEIDGDRSCLRNDKWVDSSDPQHVVNCFNDAVAGLLHGLSVRIVPGQMRNVVEQLIPHVHFTMRRFAEDEDEHFDSDEDKIEKEKEFRREGE